jgi:hypothetical protein
VLSVSPMLIFFAGELHGPAGTAGHSTGTLALAITSSILGDIQKTCKTEKTWQVSVTFLPVVRGLSTSYDRWKHLSLRRLNLMQTSDCGVSVLIKEGVHLRTDMTCTRPDRLLTQSQPAGLQRTSYSARCVLLCRMLHTDASRAVQRSSPLSQDTSTTGNKSQFPLTKFFWFVTIMETSASLTWTTDRCCHPRRVRRTVLTLPASTVS